jgi:hypothetical protein
MSAAKQAHGKPGRLKLMLHKSRYIGVVLYNEYKSLHGYILR